MNKSICWKLQNDVFQIIKDAARSVKGLHFGIFLVSHLKTKSAGGDFVFQHVFGGSYDPAAANIARENPNHLQMYFLLGK